MKVVIGLPSGDVKRLIEHCDDYIQQLRDVSEAVQGDSSLNWEKLLSTTADVEALLDSLAHLREALQGGQQMADPSMLQHASSVYHEMLIRSKTVREGEVSIVVYEGALTHLIIQDLGHPNPYYTKIKQALEGMGCMKQLKRGGGGQPSQWELIEEPSRELYDTWVATEPEEVEEDDISAQQIKALNERLIVVEKALGVV